MNTIHLAHHVYQIECLSIDCWCRSQLLDWKKLFEQFYKKLCLALFILSPSSNRVDTYKDTIHQMTTYVDGNGSRSRSLHIDKCLCMFDHIGHFTFCCTSQFTMIWVDFHQIFSISMLISINYSCSLAKLYKWTSIQVSKAIFCGVIKIPPKSRVLGEKSFETMKIKFCTLFRH